jgi:hypothetical protein
MYFIGSGSQNDYLDVLSCDVLLASVRIPLILCNVRKVFHMKIKFHLLYFGTPCRVTIQMQ